MKSTSDTLDERPLPLFAKAAGAMARGGEYRGSVAIAKLPRLTAALEDKEGALVADLHLARNRQGRPHLFGALRGELGLVCQRCLRPFRWPLEVAVDLRLVETEAQEADALKEGECWRVEDDRLPLHEIVEDEALLALPIAPRCGRDDCTAAG